MELPTLEEPRSDAERVVAALEAADVRITAPDLEIDLALARSLLGLLRAESVEGATRLRAWRRCGELIGFAPAGTHPLGLGVDLGTPISPASSSI